MIFYFNVEYSVKNHITHATPRNQKQLKFHIKPSLKILINCDEGNMLHNFI